MSDSPFANLDTSLLRSTRAPVEQRNQASPSPAQHTAPTKSIGQPTNQSINQSTNRLTNPSMNPSINPSINRVMDKPRGFYITEQVNQRIDEAVRFFQEKHGLKKVDRSIVVTALLENEALWTEEALDLIVDRVINQLTKRLMNR